MEENPSPRNGAEMKVLGEGKTVAEAEAEALEKLASLAGSFDREAVELTIISEGSKGFLGMGSSRAKVEATLALAIDGGDWEESREDIDEAKSVYLEAEEAAVSEEQDATESLSSEEAQARLEEYLEKVLVALGLEASVAASDEDEVLVGNITGEDLGLFIGRHGQTIDAIQYLANVVVYRGHRGRKRIIVDAEDYRERRQDVLQALADRAASEVLKGRPQFEMKPMSAAERRVVHMHLQDRAGIETSSDGREPFRRVIVTRSGNW